MAQRKNILWTQNKEIILPSKVTRKIKKGDIVMIQTPGGGGWGSVSKNK